MARRGNRVLDRISRNDDEILEAILKDYPNLTREKALEMCAAFGFDLDVSSTDQDDRPERS